MTRIKIKHYIAVAKPDPELHVKEGGGEGGGGGEGRGGCQSVTIMQSQPQADRHLDFPEQIILKTAATWNLHQYSSTRPM